MARTLVLDENGIKSLNCVVEYNFDHEMKHYIEHCAQGNNVECHVFISLLDLYNRLHGRNDKPEDFLRPAETL
jgi:hypothetical protein